MNKVHKFFIPVMGTGFTIDSPIKVAKYGISSVVSLVDDTLIEQMRKYYANIFEKEYTPIKKSEEDSRARRITAYLDLMDVITKESFDILLSQDFTDKSDLTRYFQMLPDDIQLKRLYYIMFETTDLTTKQKLQQELKQSMQIGDIDVNIMTKLDRINFDAQGLPLPDEYSDALAALRGFARSTVNAAVVFSAGLNRKLYSYCEKFDDFFADPTGFIKKKVILKVSDYRSALIQGKFFAKKGIWVSEYRIESGLNCGGHAFATDGMLMGPILEEFKIKKQELIGSLHEVYNNARAALNKTTFDQPHETLITCQGGIGTSKENELLLKYYDIDQTGWGSPFLLVPDATNVDRETLTKLSLADDQDIFVSDVSPLNVPFNNLRNSGSELKKQQLIELGTPGAKCIKGHLVTNTEFTEKPICTASRQYQQLKIQELELLDLDKSSMKKAYDKIVEKACICHQLGESAMINCGEGKEEDHFPAICPGPNLAYFSKVVTLKEMIDHIYGRINLLVGQEDRPHMFAKELSLYMDYLFNQIKQCAEETLLSQASYFIKFKNNLIEAIEYYKKVLPSVLEETQEFKERFVQELDVIESKLEYFFIKNNLIEA